MDCVRDLCSSALKDDGIRSEIMECVGPVAALMLEQVIPYAVALSVLILLMFVAHFAALFLIWRTVTNILTTHKDIPRWATTKYGSPFGGKGLGSERQSID